MNFKLFFLQLGAVLCVGSFAAWSQDSYHENAGLTSGTAPTGPAGTISVPQGPDEDKTPVIDYYVTTEKNGIKGFYAKKGDLLLEYALTHRIRYARLLEWNDLQDAPLEENMFIYLSKKRRSGRVPHYTVERGMTMQLISQEVGVDLATLLFYNKLSPDEQPVPGTVLNLQGPVENKPEVYTLKKTAREPVERSRDIETGESYIYKKDMANSAYVTQREEAGADEEPEEPAISDAAKSLAAGPDEVGGDQEQGTTEDPQKLTKKEKRALRKVERETEDLTPLEKLKRHMDKNVYANRDRDWREEEAADETQSGISSEQITTFPARKVTDSGNTAGREESVSGERFHTVRSGDTAFSIAKRYGITLKQLSAWNDLPASMVVKKGQRLRVAP